MSYLKSPVFNHNLPKRKQKCVTHTLGKKKSIEIVSEWPQMLDLADKNFKVAIISMLN